MLLSGHKRPVIWIGFTFDGKRLATTSFDGTVRFWNPSTGDVLSTLSVGGDLGAAAFTPDNRRLIVAGLGDPSLSVFDAVSNDLLLVLRGHGAPVSSVAISPDGMVVASSSNEGTVRMWRAATPAEIDKWKTEAAGIK